MKQYIHTHYHSYKKNVSVNCLQMCRWTVSKSVGELSSNVSVNCLQNTCRWTVLFPVVLPVSRFARGSFRKYLVGSFVLVFFLLLLFQSQGLSYIGHDWSYIQLSRLPYNIFGWVPMCVLGRGWGEGEGEGGGGGGEHMLIHTYVGSCWIENGCIYAMTSWYHVSL